MATVCAILLMVSTVRRRPFYLDELNVKEIAHALSIPEGTVKSRLYHSRQKLKEILERITP